MYVNISHSGCHFTTVWFIVGKFIADKIYNLALTFYLQTVTRYNMENVGTFRIEDDKLILF